MSHTPEPRAPADLRESARLLYESTDLTLTQVAKEVGAGERSVKRWSSADGGWRKAGGPALSERAQKAADRIAATVSTLEPEATIEQRQEALWAVREEAAVDERAELIARHRQQWRLVDGLVAEAVRGRDLQAAKLAETICRTISGKQVGERKAYGLDNTDSPASTPTTIVIERC
ncbi:hypothetical protein [Azotobacter beijerinckii]|uniref:hypothetical protein n=1 Tax=Azotobacter beijerinckii TaxID=170623 RepID=UPI0029543E99|nr:hypothetical protein [Azotobacter beijerinckii]MDV7210780.1 hypothetical protein [Azotobacter beijerinckii]